MNVLRCIALIVPLAVVACDSDSGNQSKPDTTVATDPTDADTTSGSDTSTPSDTTVTTAPDTTVTSEPDTTVTTEPDTVEPDVTPGPQTCDELGITPIAFAPVTDSHATFVVDGHFAATAPALTSTCGTATREAVVRFTPPSAGLWELDANGPATTTDVLLDVRAQCDDTTSLSCAARGSGHHGARVTVDLADAESAIVVVQGLEVGASTWQIIARPLDHVAALGEPCGATIGCPSDSTCLTQLATPICMASDTPAVSSFTTTWLNVGQAVHDIRGTDYDLDPAHVWLVGALAQDGEVYGDEDGEVPIELGPPAFTVDAEEGSWSLTVGVDVDYFVFFITPIVEADLVIEDAQGHRSAPLHIVYDAPQTRVDAALGDACDPTGYPRRCLGNVCVDGTCVAPTAPTLATVEAFVGENDYTVLRVTGSDTTRDASTLKLVISYTDGSTRNATWYFNDAGTSWDGDNYTAWRTAKFPGTGIPSGVAVTVADATGLTSNTLSPDWPPTPHVTFAEGEACTTAMPIASCDTGLVCSADLFDVVTCQPEVAPELYNASVSVNATTGFIEVSVDGADRNGDLAGLNLAFTNASGRTLVGIVASGLVPSPVGQTFFTTRAIVDEDVNLADFSYLRVEIVDAKLRSNPILIPLQEEIKHGATCVQGAHESLCSLVQDQTCGLGSTCEDAVAPVLSQLVVHRLSSNDIGLEFSGSDVNGDATDVQLSVNVDGEVRNLNPPFTEPDTDPFGQLEFSSTTKLKGWGSAGDELAVTLWIRDFTDRLSEPLTVAVPPVVALDGACSGDDTIDRCVDGSACDAGFCKQHLPVIGTVSTTTANSGRDLLVVVDGTDQDLVLSKAALTFSGGGADKVENVTIGALTGLAHTITWTGFDFHLEVTFPQWGTALNRGRTSVSAKVTDNATFVSNVVSGVVLPVQNVGESCDATNRCQAGLTCGDGACVEIAADPCAGASWAEATELAAWDGDSIVVPLDMSDGSLVDASFCPNATASKAKGPEHFVRVVPDRTGTLQIQSETPGADQIWVRVTEGQCVDPDAPLACVRYDAAATVQATEGVPLYIEVDTYYFQTGQVNLHLDWQ